MTDLVPGNSSTTGVEGSKPSGEGDIFNLLSDVPDSSPKNDLGDDSGDDDESPATDESGEDTEESDEPDEEVSGDGEEQEEESGEDEEKVDEEIKNASGVTFKALKKAYPDIFKKFPQLQHAIGQHNAYKEVFVTVNDAKEANEKVGVFDYLDSRITEGDLTPILRGFSNQDRAQGTKTVQKIAEKFLPDLLAVDEKAFALATQPLLATILRNAKAFGTKNGNKNLPIAADLISEYIFGSKELPEQKKAADPELEEREKRITQREQGISQQEYNRQANDLQSRAQGRIYKEITSRIDPEGVLSEFDREAKILKVATELTSALQSDPTHMRIMDSLRKRLISSNYSEEEKARFLGTYLARAKPVLGPILRKAGSTVGGVKKAQPRNDGRKAIPSTSKSAPSFKNGKLPSATELRNKGVSALQILQSLGD